MTISRQQVAQGIAFLRKVAILLGVILAVAGGLSFRQFLALSLLVYLPFIIAESMLNAKEDLRFAKSSFPFLAVTLSGAFVWVLTIRSAIHGKPPEERISFALTAMPSLFAFLIVAVAANLWFQGRRLRKEAHFR